jgi:hypothetical protein
MAQKGAVQSSGRFLVDIGTRNIIREGNDSFGNRSIHGRNAGLIWSRHPISN